ncbi:unnamed protein product, partial [Mesorhabditis belari]|uniref:SCP domain-containing protein n=1 Tax=Mesorhabditis belari TaxID=2138241 RepID=A0AAF3FJD1_9BILA
MAMKILTPLAVFVTAVSAQFEVPMVRSVDNSTIFPVAVQNHILATLNGLRARVARGVEPWARKPKGTFYPKAARMYKLLWDPVLARDARTRLDTLEFLRDPNPEGIRVGTLDGLVPISTDCCTGELFIGTIRGTTQNHKKSAQQYFDDTWTKNWYGRMKLEGVIGGLIYQRYPHEIHGYFSEWTSADARNHIQQIISGDTQKIGCAYRNMTDLQTYAILCRLLQKGVSAEIPIYATGGAIGSKCPLNAPVNPASGLCVPKVAAG